MILIPVPVFGEGGPGHLAVVAVSRLVGGISVERIIGDQPIANGGTEVGTGFARATCEEQQSQKRDDKTFHDHAVPFISF